MTEKYKKYLIALALIMIGFITTITIDIHT